MRVPKEAKGETNMTKMEKAQKLQSESNQIRERMGYMKHIENLEACNRRLDKIDAELSSLIADMHKEAPGLL